MPCTFGQKARSFGRSRRRTARLVEVNVDEEVGRPLAVREPDLGIGLAISPLLHLVEVAGAVARRQQSVRAGAARPADEAVAAKVGEGPLAGVGARLLEVRRLGGARLSHLLDVQHHRVHLQHSMLERLAGHEVVLERKPGGVVDVVAPKAEVVEYEAGLLDSLHIGKRRREVDPSHSRDELEHVDGGLSVLWRVLLAVLVLVRALHLLQALAGSVAAEPHWTSGVLPVMAVNLPPSKVVGRHLEPLEDEQEVIGRADVRAPAQLLVDEEPRRELLDDVSRVLEFDVDDSAVV